MKEYDDIYSAFESEADSVDIVKIKKRLDWRVSLYDHIFNVINSNPNLKRINLEKLNFHSGPFGCGRQVLELQMKAISIASKIIAYIKVNCTLEYLNLSNNGMPTFSFMEAIKSSSLSLIELDLSHNFACDAFLGPLVEWMESNKSLRRINLRCMQGIEDLGLLFEHLASNSSLQFLDCSENSISEDSIEKLAPIPYMWVHKKKSKKIKKIGKKRQFFF
jgi:hypothetical protein